MGRLRRCTARDEHDRGGGGVGVISCQTQRPLTMTPLHAKGGPRRDRRPQEDAQTPDSCYHGDTFKF